MKKIFHKIHLWLAIPLGIIIAVICLSGALLVFETEINELIHRNRYFVKEVKDAPIRLDELISKVNAQLDGNSVRSVQIPSAPNRNYTMGLAEGFRSSAYVNPYTGELIEITSFGDSFFGKIRQLHRWLLDDSRKVGKPLVGYSTLAFVLLLITGLIICWPKGKKQLKNLLRIKTQYGWKRFWRDLHVTGGMYVFIGLLVLSLTGLTYSFRWYSKAFYGVLGVELSEPDRNRQRENSPNRPERGNPNADRPSGENNSAVRGERRGRGEGRGSRPQNGEAGNNSTSQGEGRRNSFERENNPQPELNLTHWQTVLTGMKANNPQFRNITIQDGSVVVAQSFTFGNIRASDRYTFDSQTGEITSIQLYKDQEKSAKVRGWIFSLHVGAWGGLFSKTLTFLVALVGGILPITGYYLFFIKRKRKT
jgi:uncharacterized iron-regulated membrane protein